MWNVPRDWLMGVNRYEVDKCCVVLQNELVILLHK